VVIAEKRHLADPLPMANPANFKRPVHPSDFDAKFAIDHEKQCIHRRLILHQDTPDRNFPFTNESC